MGIKRRKLKICFTNIFQLNLLTIASVFKATKIDMMEGYFTFKII